ncbi:MAG: hypothetical protein KAI16_03225 [Candidatus Pacebacteria bacterium]|nr:hypothetical protein [Candidatus Paceibacterota bacterium]
MKKKIIGLIILAISLVVVYFGIYVIQNKALINSYVEYNEGQGENSFVRCNLSIFEPEFASVFFAMNQGHISFKKTSLFSQTKQEWENSYIGGTTIKNTTFPELLKMVKEDCYQFQEDYDNPKVNEGGIDWGYREADNNQSDTERYKKMVESQGQKFIEIDSSRSLVEQLMEYGMTLEEIVEEAQKKDGDSDESVKQQVLQDPMVINYLNKINQ